MIVVSALLVLIALITFVIGVFIGDGMTMIWASIGASLLAALTLMIGVMRGRKAAPEAGELVTIDLPQDTFPVTQTQEAEAPTLTSGTAVGLEDLAEEEEEELEEPVSLAEEPEEISVPFDEEEEEEAFEPIVAPARSLSRTPSRAKSPAKKAAAKKTAARKPAAKKTATKKTAAKPAARKTAAKKTAAKKTAAKPAAKKAAPKKSAAKKTAAKKTAAKASPKKAAPAKAAKATRRR